MEPVDEIPLARSLPRASFTDEAQFAREREAALFADWFCAGRSESLPGPGDYLTADVAGESILIRRTARGGLAASYNVCRHRGSRLVPAQPGQPAADFGPSGRFGRAIRCPYHGWTYGLEGQLRTAPFLASDLRAHKKRLGLHPVQAGEWGGFVFIRLGPAPREDQAGGAVTVADAGPSLADWLGEVPGRLARYPLERLRAARRLVYPVAANWKVIVENYNECYHCGPVHPELCELVPAFRGGGSGLDWDDGVPQRPGTFTFTRSGVSDRAPFPGLSAAERTRHKGELLLPNLMLSLSADHVAAFTLWPQAAQRTTVVCDFLFAPEEMARPGFDPSDAVGFWDLVNRQDWRICEQVQDGMTSRAFTAGYLAPMEEPSADVTRYIQRRLGGQDPPKTRPGRSGQDGLGGPGGPDGQQRPDRPEGSAR